MSLSSDSELYLDFKFRGKITQAIAKVLLEFATSGNDEEKAYAKRSLNNLHHVAEQLTPTVLAVDAVDSAASDKTIEDAARQVIRAAV